MIRSVHGTISLSGDGSEPIFGSYARCEAESIEHLLVACYFGKAVRRVVISSLGLVFWWENCTVQGNMSRWIGASLRLAHLPLLCYWSIWKARNNTIFRGFKSEVQEVVVGVICLLKDYPELPRVSRCRRIGDGQDIRVATGFFNGVAAQEMGGARAVIYISQTHYYHLRFSYGRSTNMRAESLGVTFCC